MHAGAYRERWLGFEDGEHRAQHAPFTVGTRVRRARSQDELPTATGDVGREQADVVTRGLFLDEPGKLREARGQLRRAELLEHVVGGTEVDEADGDVSVLGLVVLTGQPARSRAGMSSSISPGAIGAGGSSGGGLDGGARRTSIPSPFTRPSASTGICDAVSGLTRISPALAAVSISSVRVTSGPMTSSSRCSAPVVMTRKTPLCTPCDMRNVTAPRSVTTGPRARKAARISTAAPTARGRVLVTVEEQAQRVAAEFQEVATGREGDVEQRGEGVVEDRGELLGTHPATARQPFRELREAGNVGEAEGPGDHRPLFVGSVARQVADVGRERVRAGGRAGTHGRHADVMQRLRAQRARASRKKPMYPDCRARSVVHRVCGGRDRGEAPEVHGRTMSKAAAAALSMVLFASAFSAVEANAAEGGTSQLVSVAANGSATLTAASTTPAVSGDGRYVAFDSAATQVVTGDTNGASDVFVRDRVAGKNVRVSKNDQGNQAAGASTDPVMSPNGRYVAFVSSASIDDGVGEGNEGVCDPPGPDEAEPGQGSETRDQNGTKLDVYVFNRDADGNGDLRRSGGAAHRRTQVVLRRGHRSRQRRLQRVARPERQQVGLGRAGDRHLGERPLRRLRDGVHSSRPATRTTRSTSTCATVTPTPTASTTSPRARTRSGSAAAASTRPTVRACRRR